MEIQKNNNENELKQIICASSNLLIISHILPDGDNIGSVIGAMLALKADDRKITAVVNGLLPPYYGFLKGADELIPAEKLEEISPDVVLCLDMSDRQRGGDIWLKMKGKPIIVNIDHHISNDHFGDYNYVLSGASSTAEIIVALLNEWDIPLNRSIAEALFTGIVTDSGCFTYRSTSPQTMRMAALLLEQNPNLEAIRENVLENVSFKRKKLLAAVLDHAVLARNGKLCYAAIDYNEINSLAVEGPDFEGIIDHLIGVTGVTYAVFFREIAPRKVKVGFRGRGDMDVTEVASQFGGGGHRAAGGCGCEGNLDAVVEAVIGKVIGYLEEA